MLMLWVNVGHFPWDSESPLGPNVLKPEAPLGPTVLWSSTSFASFEPACHGRSPG